jgi:hypothetical protein
LPFLGSADGSSNAVFNITNTSPNHSAIAAHGGQALSGVNTGGDGVGTYGGPSNGNGTQDGLGTGGSGVNATGGEGIAEYDFGGSGVSANGGDATGSSGISGAGVTATGGSGGFIGGDGIDAYGGAGSGIGGNGIYAESGTGTAAGEAGIFKGDVNVIGNLSKSGGSFKIDHPLDPANKYLYHSFVESPEMKNIYDGTSSPTAAAQPS